MVEGQNRLQILETYPLTPIYALRLMRTGTHTQAWTQNNKMKKNVTDFRCMYVSVSNLHLSGNFSAT